jgi:hypothetical protein
MNRFILFFKPSFFIGPETELKCKIGILSYTDIWCLVPFRINIYYDRASLSATIIRNGVKYESLNFVVICSAEYVVRKFNYTARRHK